MFRRCNLFLQGSVISSTAWMDIAIGSWKPRRVTFELFTDKCPMACENFVKLCTGEMVIPVEPTPVGLRNPQFVDQIRPQLHYKNSTIHRVVPGFLVQGGDILKADGYNQLSVFGRTFEAPAETESSVFDQRGLLGTAVCAPNLNGSQFFVLTAKEARHLDGTCIAFGRVSKGMEVIDSIERLGLVGEGRPKMKVRIVGCGI